MPCTDAQAEGPSAGNRPGAAPLSAMEGARALRPLRPETREAGREGIGFSRPCEPSGPCSKFQQTAG